MNDPSSSFIINLTQKLDEKSVIEFYNKSVYKWLELGASPQLIQRFPFIYQDGYNYVNTSFYRYDDIDVVIEEPIKIANYAPSFDVHYKFPSEVFDKLIDPNCIPRNNDLITLLWKYMNGRNIITIDDIRSTLLLPLLNYDSGNHDLYFYTPIAIFIIREILRFN